MFNFIIKKNTIFLMISKENKVSKCDIDKYGIIYTPKILVDKILDLIPNKYYKNRESKWLDIGAGTGNFSINLYNRLLNNLSSEIPDITLREKHIIENMITMSEIYQPHIDKLMSIFSNKANIITENFLSISSNLYYDINYDVIIGNPPYNTGGKIKTPTNNNQKKKDDGKATYTEFIKLSLKLLKPHGYLALIVPSIWLKPDKAGIYNLLTSYKIHKLHCFSTSETNKLFNYQAQTPTCFFLLQKSIIESRDKYVQNISIYDKISDDYVSYLLQKNLPIPTTGITIINKLIPYIEKYGTLKVYKTNTPSKKTNFVEYNDNYLLYANIKTCIYENNKPRMIINYSDTPQNYYNISKLVLANKMYGIPYFDITGEYGISTRDNYIISNKDYSIDKLKYIQYFLSTKFALYIFSTTNYRMRYLERYAFEFIPNITVIPEFPLDKLQNNLERDKAVSKFFNLSDIEIARIDKEIKLTPNKFYI